MKAAEYCFVCVVLFALHPFIQPSLLMSFVALFFHRSLESYIVDLSDRPAKYFFVCICSIEPSLLNLPFFVAFSLHSHRSPELITHYDQHPSGTRLTSRPK